LKWTCTTGGQVSSSPAIGSNGLVYIGSNDSKVYAIEQATGAVQWSVTLSSQSGLCSPSIGKDGTVYVAMSNGPLYALNGTSGAIEWTFKDSQDGLTVQSPAIGSDGTVYFGWEGTMFAIR